VHIQVNHWKLPLRRWGWRRAIAQIEWVVLGRAKRFEGGLETLRQVVAQIQSLQPDHVLISGDLTALAVEEEFRLVRNALASLDNPNLLTVVPGNHDRYTARAVRTHRFENHFSHLLHSDLPNGLDGKTFPLVRLLKDELAIIGLDSTRLAPLPGISFGRLGKEQLQSLAMLMHEPVLRHRHLCVVVHHAPLRIGGRPDRISHGLLDGQELLQLLKNHSCSIHHGHIHRRYWHQANSQRPHIFNAGSVTMCDDRGYWVMELKPESAPQAEQCLLDAPEKPK
jgi:3',5'-cyclic AMP phosphodiesterase CpdA